ncbi:MAG: hypothetical protein RL721_615 [Candidatus Eisenbacteria bacterium]|jgi:predicted NBD/HSP70 family sugar kinase
MSLTTPPLDRRGPRRTDPGRPRPLADAVLRLIWQEQEISRADIARRADLSRSTVSEIVSLLLPTGLVAEIGTGPSSGGRRPIVLRFQDESCVILGVEVGASHVAVALTDLRGKVLVWRHRQHAVRPDPEGTRRLVRELSEACLTKHGGSTRNLVGVGIALPSPVDPLSPERLSEVVLPDWNGRHGFESLAEAFGVPLFVDNDANLGALAERWWGAGRGVDDFAYVKVATGIGSGHMSGGRLFRGSRGVAGEIGHMAIDPQGEPCVCGLRGCLATFVGSQALITRAQRLGAEYPDSPLAKGEPTLAAIEEASLAGDPLGSRLVHEAAENLGIAIASMLNLMNPAKVILGGGLTHVGKRLLEPLRETVRRRTLVSSLDSSDIVVSELGPRAGAVGAATMVLDAALNDSRLFPTTHRRARPR